MTMDDAVDRACTLWGFGQIVRVQLLADGGADVRLSPADDLDIVTARHHLDRYGKPTCDCCRDDTGDHFHYEGVYDFRGVLLGQRAIRNAGHTGSILTCAHPSCARVRKQTP